MKRPGLCPLISLAIEVRVTAILIGRHFFEAIKASFFEKSPKEELMFKGFRVVGHVCSRLVYVREGYPNVLCRVLTRAVGTQRVVQSEAHLLRGLGELPGRVLGIVQRIFSFPDEVSRLKVRYHLLGLNCDLIQIGGGLGGREERSRLAKEFSFNVETWSHAGLWYCLVGDVSANDMDNLAELLKGAGS